MQTRKNWQTKLFIWNGICAKRQAAGKTTLPLRGKLMVCIGDEHGAALVRYGPRFAQRRQLPWLVVHIVSRGQRSPELEQALALASQLGARVLTLSSPAVADALPHTLSAYADSFAAENATPTDTRDPKDDILPWPR